MIKLKLILHSMLSLPVVREAHDHYTILVCILAYFGLLFLVLKIFQFNKDKFDE